MKDEGHVSECQTVVKDSIVEVQLESRAYGTTTKKDHETEVVIENEYNDKIEDKNSFLMSFDQTTEQRGYEIPGAVPGFNLEKV